MNTNLNDRDQETGNLIEPEKILRDTILEKCTFGETVLFYKNISSYFEQFNFNGVSITTTQFFLLDCLNKLGETTYYSLSKQLPYNSKLILNLIKDLEKLNLIERTKVGNKKIIKITSPGKVMFEALGKEKNIFFQNLNDHDISWEELVIFYNVMEKVNKVFLKKT